MVTQFDIDKIRKEIAKFQRTLVWYQKRGGLLPYDWHNSFGVYWMNFLDYMKINYQGKVKKKDKRGHWR